MKKIEIKNESLIKKIIGVILIILVFSFLIGIVCVNKEPIFSNEQYYSQTELDKQIKENYDKGFTAGINSYEDLNKHLEDVIDDYNKVSQELEEKQNIINQNNTTITENEITINNLQKQLETLTSDHVAEIAGLQAQINALQLQNQTLQNDNATNLVNIIELNKQIEDLQAQVSTLTAQIQENLDKVNEYEENKNAWQNSIAYYESFIQALETDTQAVALFEVKNAIYKAQIVTKGTSASVTNPADTEISTFIGWYVNNELIDVDTYPITTNIKFVARFENKLNVKFMLDSNTEFASQKVNKNNCPTQLDNLPTKEGFAFDGFTINNVDIVDYTTYPITQDTIFVAKFTKVHTVNFIDNDKIVATQQIRNGEFAQEIEGYNWLFNNEIINILEFPIYQDVTLIAEEIIKIGLYETGTNNIKMTWEELISNNYFTVSNSTLSAGSKTLYETGDLYIDNSITIISDYTFNGCKFTNIIFPESVTTIGTTIFSDCSNLVSIKFLAQVVVQTGYPVFSRCSKLSQIFVRSSLLDAYWGDMNWYYYYDKYIVGC